MNFTWLILGGAALFLVGAANWRYGVFGALLLAVFEGAIRKWVLPQASQMVYFGKDFLLLGAYAGYFFAGRRLRSTGISEGLRMVLALAAGWTFLESFNPGTGSATAGLFGWKAYVFYVPLCFMVPALFRDAEALDRFLRWYVVIALPVGVLGAAQFSAGVDSPLNVYAPGTTIGEATNIAVFGEDQFVRVTGTFSYISGYSAYLIAMLALLVPILAWSRNLLWRLVFTGTLVLVIGNVMMTGSRATALGAAIVLGGFALLTPFTSTQAERERAWIHWLAGAVAVVAAAYLFEDAVVSLQQRTEASWEEGKTRLWAAVLEPWDYLGSAGIFGYGNGIGQPAVTALRTVLNLPEATFSYASPTDAENSRVLMEQGVPGFFLWYGLRVSLVLALWNTRVRLRSPFLRQLALGAFLVLFFQFFTTTMFAHTANIYHWFLAGFILLLPRLDHARRPLAASRLRRHRRTLQPPQIAAGAPAPARTS